MNASSPNPIIAITMGDPCGVGPEILIRALGSEEILRACIPVVVGDRRAIERAAQWAGTDADIETLSGWEGNGPPLLKPPAQGKVLLVAISDLGEQDLTPGHPSRAACQATIRSIERAVELAMSRRVDAVCTCPIHKANLHRHGFPFPGHTEFLSRLTGTGDVVMMLAGPRLRVSLATIHLPLASVPAALNPGLLASTLEITALALMRDFGIQRPRLGVAALNPHAGEQGRFGDEETTIITPAIEHCRQRLGGSFCSIQGPFPPDTVFFRAYEGEFDAVVAMYHDQGLIPIKLVHFYEAVNVTLGMGIIRTSVDHGTAYDLVGTGKADARSLKAAILLAARMAANRRKPHASYQS